MTNQHGGRREGAGPKPRLNPLYQVRLLTPEARQALVCLTRQRRALTGDATISQEQVANDILIAAWRELDAQYQDAAEVAT